MELIHRWGEWAGGRNLLRQLSAPTNFKAFFVDIFLMAFSGHACMTLVFNRMFVSPIAQLCMASHSVSQSVSLSPHWRLCYAAMGTVEEIVVVDRRRRRRRRYFSTYGNA